jgi:hypothetical protein
LMMRVKRSFMSILILYLSFRFFVGIHSADFSV